MRACVLAWPTGTGEPIFVCAGLSPDTRFNNPCARVSWHGQSKFESQSIQRSMKRGTIIARARDEVSYRFCRCWKACKAGSPASFRSSSSLHCGAHSSAHFSPYSPLLRLFGQSHLVPQHEFWHHRTWFATRKRGDLENLKMLRAFRLTPSKPW